jgi:hypothetical protein
MAVSRHDYWIDWGELVNRLRSRSGRSLAWIARHVADMDERTIQRFGRGEATTTPRFHQGMALLDFAADHLTPDDWRCIRLGHRS